MRRIFEDIFIKRYPTIDLHGLDRETSIMTVNDFVKENYKLRNHDIVIIHGIGTGIVRQAVHDALRNNGLVIEYKLHNFNLGMTIVKIK